MPIVPRIASLTLDVVVIGGGVGGLAVAYMFSQAGHRVRVLEKQDLSVLGGGRRVAPNMSKILRQWVGEEELKKLTTRCVGSPFIRLETGEGIGYLPWKPAAMHETGGEFLLTHHEDLVRLLYDLATGAGARVDFYTEVVSVNRAPSTSVTLKSGEIVRGDLLIGADGTKSIMRKALMPECVTRSTLTVYTGMVRAEDMRYDPQLIKLLRGDEWPMWLGEYKAFTGHAVRGGKGFSFDIFSWNEHPSFGREEGWDKLIPIDDALLKGMCPLVRKVVRLAPYLKRLPYWEPPAGGIDPWVDSDKRIVLLGDAAHPSIPCGVHAASLSVEDAVVLGSLFSHLSTPDQIPTFLNAYEELRQSRCDFVGTADLGHLKMTTLPPGPEADARDQYARRGMEEWDEEQTKAQFEEFVEIFGYDAGDAAEEWWVNWGRLRDMLRYR